MAKAKQRFSWAYNRETRSVTVKDTVTGQETEFALDDLPAGIPEQLELYGLGKVLQDRTSQDAAEVKVDRMVKVFDRLAEGHWKAERKGGGLGVVPAYITHMEALYGFDTYTAQMSWKASSDDAKAAFLSEHAEAIQAIKDERAAAKVQSLDDLS